ncbi:hypothetical protein SAMN05428950_1012088 [Sphingomonas sp. OV641]|jgi:hypothetical protein|nr:hypothetical protein SAMN05428950_1012088 [Sphingomonas sp. OV641]
MTPGLFALGPPLGHKCVKPDKMGENDAACLDLALAPQGDAEVG